jgi:hypothetical protein
MAVRLSDLRAGHPLSPRKIPGTHFCKRLSFPQGHSATGRIRSIEKSNDLIGNRTHDLTACSVVPQRNTLPRAPFNTQYLFNKFTLSLLSNRFTARAREWFCNLFKYLSLRFISLFTVFIWRSVWILELFICQGAFIYSWGFLIGNAAVCRCWNLKLSPIAVCRKSRRICALLCIGVFTCYW